MKLSTIFSEMRAISRKEMINNGLRLADCMADIVERNEQSLMPNTAYWLTTSYEGTFLAFSDEVAGTSLAEFCEQKGDYIARENGFSECRIINFATEEINHVPADEFLKKIKELEAVTGENETEILTEDPELYLNSAAYAYRHDEVDKLRNSNKWNAYCADALYYAVDKDIDGTATHDLLSSYSLGRTMFVAAATVINAKDKSAYDDDVVEWAKSALEIIPPSVVETAKPVDVKPEALSDFILYKLIPTAAAEETAKSGDTAESEDMDRF